jgi:hypothetical protein
VLVGGEEEQGVSPSLFEGQDEDDVAELISRYCVDYVSEHMSRRRMASRALRYP